MEWIIHCTTISTDTWKRYYSKLTGELQNSYVHPVSTSGSKFSDLLKQTQAAENTISAGSMDAVFEEAARVYNVPVNLLKAIGKAESNFDPSAQSAAGAQGVMQPYAPDCGESGSGRPV